MEYDLISIYTVLEGGERKGKGGGGGKEGRRD
jgi:hypothetical protein